MNLIHKTRKVSASVFGAAANVGLTIQRALMSAAVACALLCVAAPANAAEGDPPTIDSIVTSAGIQTLMGTAIMAVAGLLALVATGYLAFLVFRAMLSWSGKAVGK